MNTDSEIDKSQRGGGLEKFARVLRRLVRVPIKEVLAEEEKCRKAKKRRKATKQNKKT